MVDQAEVGRVTSQDPALRPRPARHSYDRRRPDAGGSHSRRPVQTHRAFWQEIPILLLVAFGIAFLVKTFLVQAFFIPSASMEPNLFEGDYIIVSKYSYGYSKHSIPFSPPLFKGRILEKVPERGDIIVFKDPGGWLPDEESATPTSPVTQVLEKIGLYPTGGHLVKRVKIGRAHV